MKAKTEIKYASVKDFIIKFGYDPIKLFNSANIKIRNLIYDLTEISDQLKEIEPKYKKLITIVRDETGDEARPILNDDLPKLVKELNKIYYDNSLKYDTRQLVDKIGEIGDDIDNIRSDLFWEYYEDDEEEKDAN